MPQLNIKDAETYALVTELAFRRGVSKSAAVKAAVLDVLEQTPVPAPATRTEAEVKREVEDIMTWLRGSAGRWRDKRSSKELMDELYDDHGLPM